LTPKKIRKLSTKAQVTLKQLKQTYELKARPSAVTIRFRKFSAKTGRWKPMR